MLTAVATAAMLNSTYISTEHTIERLKGDAQVDLSSMTYTFGDVSNKVSFIPDNDDGKNSIMRNVSEHMEQLASSLTDTTIDIEPSKADAQISKSSMNSTFEGIEKNISRSVFYNIFIPDTDDGKNNTLRIVREQIEQVASSFATATMEQPMPIIIYTMGAADVITSESLASICPARLKCHHMQHYQQGNEAITLNALRQYCIERPTATVTYLHSKGSFHPRPENEVWRRILTDAALSERCYSNIGEKGCNLCGDKFLTLPTYFIPGNIFTVSCDYASQLTSLDTYDSAIMQVVKRFFILRLRKQMSVNLYSPDAGRHSFEAVFGLGRYGAENWIGSHPDIRPCDCVNTRSPLAITKGQVKMGDLELVKGRRRRHYAKIMRVPAARIRDFHVFGGMLMKWYALYGRAPGPSSWVWLHHPDGPFWLDKVTDLGENAIDNATSPLLPLETRFPSSGESLASRKLYENHGKSPEASFIFMDAYISPSVDSVGVQQEIESLKQQIAIVESSAQSSGRNATIFYNTMGNMILKEFSLCGAYSGHQCIPLAHYDTRYEGETMRQLFNFCQVNPNKSVSYIHNRVPEGQHGLSLDIQRRTMRHLTLGVTSTYFLSNSLSAQDCDVYGLKFNYMPHYALYGDMFFAKCGYINQLLPPENFTVRMESFAAEVLMQIVEKKLNVGVLEASAQNLSVGRHVMARWVVSHPSCVPCDLTNQTSHFWESEDRSRNDFSVQVPGPHDRGSSWDYNISTEALLMENPQLRLREVLFHPVHISHWQTIYNATPGNSSAFQTWFPDAESGSVV
ncbi:hypothetical protein MPSEU_000395700 [Mayamaea pseudoterrestris]|nr:hypothetical protein MPSEU_000395700 [Mayamaea pseudoterrestris]